MLKLGAIAAGVLGVAAAIAGGAGLIAKPDAVVWASAPLDRAVVVIPPQVIAMDGVMDVVVEGEPWMETRTARPIDAYAWMRGETSIYVQGLTSWTDVKTLTPDLYSYDGEELTGDIWRSNTVSAGATHIFPSDVPVGLAVVVVTRSHGPLSKISIELSRDPGYEWAWPALSAGALLAALSMVLFALLWLDVRPGRAGAIEAAEPPTETTDIVALEVGSERKSRWSRKRAPDDSAEQQDQSEAKATPDAKPEAKPDAKATPEAQPEATAPRRGKPEAKGAPEPIDTPEEAPVPHSRRARRVARDEDEK